MWQSKYASSSFIYLFMYLFIFLFIYLFIFLVYYKGLFHVSCSV